MATSSEPLSGLAFKKLDLHVHTPESSCFHGTCTPEEVVETAIDKDLAGIAITDHNSCEWVDKVMSAAEGRPLVVFPGVEITCTGGRKSVHIIALFDVTKRSKDIKVLLNILGITSNYGKEETLTNKTPIQVIEAIDNLRGIAVLAHANSSNGALSDMRGQPRTRLIQHPRLLAAEATDFLDEDKKERQRRVVDLLDGNDPNYQRKLAVYQASDNPCPDGSGLHCLEGIGSRCAHFKLERVNLEGLRQCFCDPDVRIRQDFELTTFSYPYIESVSITSGFLEGQTVEFHPGLTSILGAKGAGKSLLVEFIRFALNQEPRHHSIAEDHAAKLRERLGEYGAVEVTFVDETGKDFRVSRTYRELDGSPYDESVPYDPAQVCQVLFLSQNEIVRIAENEQEQLDFIDQFFDFRAYRSRIESLEHELERLDKRMAEGLRAYSEFDQLSNKAKSLEVELARLDKALAHPVFERFKRLELKEKIFSDQMSHLSSMIASVENASKQALSRLVPAIPEPLDRDPALLRSRDLITKAYELLEQQFSRLVQELQEQSRKAMREYEAWRDTYAAGKKEYEAYIQEMGGDYRGLALSRERAMKRLRELEQERDIAERKKQEVPDISTRRNELLDELHKEYEEYTSERRKKCGKFQTDSRGRLKLSILGSSNVDEFRERLLALKRGSYLREDEIDAICSSITPREFVLSLLRYEATRKASFLEEGAKRADIDLRRMKILADFLLSAIPYEELLALQYKAHPQDRPEILYDVGDGDYRPLARISVGQKCTAMLIMALSDGIMPIVIDQPEDSLDIRSIWDDMCLKLRTGKERRQFIFTTHSSSLAVASDTDCYVALEGSASRGRVAFVGSMDHEPMSREVLRYLEGGLKTYKMKFLKYGGEKQLDD
jgi:ABC-type enterochelin transport system ATPase subunit